VHGGAHASRRRASDERPVGPAGGKKKTRGKERERERERVSDPHTAASKPTLTQQTTAGFNKDRREREKCSAMRIFFKRKV
jgi:hypothetical protein